MNDSILRIAGTPIFVKDLPSGDLKIWHPYNEGVRQIVEPICRGRGRWHPGYNNWVVFAAVKHLVLADLLRAVGGRHG